MDLTYLVDHICQQAFNLVVVDVFLAAKADGSGELGNWHTGAANRLFSFLCLFKATGQKDLPEQVAKRDISAALQSEVDASLHKFVLPFLESQVEVVELAPFDTPAKRQEQLLQSREGLQ